MSKFQQEMQNNSYTLEDVMVFASATSRILSERFLWFVLNKAAFALSALHMCRKIHGNIRPCNIIFNDGVLSLRDSETAANTKGIYNTYYIPPDTEYTAKYDIFSLGRVIYTMSRGLRHEQYTTTLLGFLNRMMSQEWAARPSVQEIVNYCDMSIHSETMEDMIKFQQTYESLYKTYSVELQSLVARYKAEAASIIEKKKKIIEMENDFFYKHVAK